MKDMLITDTEKVKVERLVSPEPEDRRNVER
jgi:hypothetical protein